VNILIVEPSKIYQLALEKIFASYATNIFISESGAEAKKIYHSVSIDLVCLSFYLADMDGIELVSTFRKLKWGETLPILMITSKESQDATIKSLRDGVTEVFRKNNLLVLEKYLATYAQYARQHAGLSGDILLIDGDSRQAKDICDFFKDSQLKFVHFTSAEEAADMARAAEFDLVITNVVLSGPMSGMALIREIREINNTMYRVPILAITDETNVSQKIELLRAGANDSVQKPVLLEELSVRVKNLLQNKKLFDTVELQKQQLKEMAFRDPLTGLYNRHLLVATAERSLEEAYRHSYSISMMVIDLDHFKKVNDTFGHATGDVVLQAVADLLLRTFRGSDTAVRFGGEEFVILLPHCDGEAAITKAQSLRLQIEKLTPASIPITASIGVSHTLENVRTSYDELFAAADEAVYAAKMSGRNCVAFREPVISRIH
jgi:two-component system cell cycle response regulator